MSAWMDGLDDDPLFAPDSGGGTAVLERPVEEEQEQRSNDGEGDRFAQYVPKHDPKNYPVCPECKRIFEEYGAGGGF